MPVSLTQFLYTLLTRGSENTDLQGRVERLICSIGSDLIYAANHGKVKPPIYILLPSAVKTLTGNVKLIQILNRFCHGVSYTQLEEIDTVLCLQKLASAGDGAALPGRISSHVFTTLAFDNTDRLEETITGESTSHRVNGIQPKADGPAQGKIIPSITKLKQRNITAPPKLIALYNAGKKLGPSSIDGIEIGATAELQEAKFKNYI